MYEDFSKTINVFPGKEKLPRYVSVFIEQYLLDLL